MLVDGPIMNLKWPRPTSLLHKDDSDNEADIISEQKLGMAKLSAGLRNFPEPPTNWLKSISRR